MTENVEEPRLRDELPLADDLADVLARMVVGWTDIIGHDLAQHPDVVRVMARYRASTPESVEEPTEEQDDLDEFIAEQIKADPHFKAALDAALSRTENVEGPTFDEDGLAADIAASVSHFWDTPENVEEPT